MKKIIVMSLIAVVIGGLIIFAVSQFPKEEEEPSRLNMFALEYEAYVISTLYPTDVIWIGEVLEFEYPIPIREETRLDEDVLKIREGFRHLLVVINDYNGEINVSDDEYKLVLEKLTHDTRYNLCYIGQKQLNHLLELGYPKDTKFEEYDTGALYYHTGAELTLRLGTFDQFEYSEYGDGLLYSFSDSLERYYNKQK